MSFFSCWKLLAAALLLSSPLVAACTAATGSAEPSSASSSAASMESPEMRIAKDGFVLVGVETPLALRAAPKLTCKVFTDGIEGPVDPVTVPSDDDGYVHVSIETPDEKAFALTLRCEDAEHFETTYSFDLQGVENATKLAKGE